VWGVALLRHFLNYRDIPSCIAYSSPYVHSKFNASLNETCTWYNGKQYVSPRSLSLRLEGKQNASALHKPKNIYRHRNWDIGLKYCRREIMFIIWTVYTLLHATPLPLLISLPVNSYGCVTHTFVPTIVEYIIQFLDAHTKWKWKIWGFHEGEDDGGGVGFYTVYTGR
jgi:hypothetical protein